MFAANFQTNATYKLIKGLTVCLPFTFIGIERFPNNARCSAVFRLLIAQLTTVPSSILNALIYSKSSPLYNSFPKQRQFRRNKIFNWFFSFFLFFFAFLYPFFLIVFSNGFGLCLLVTAADRGYFIGASAAKQNKRTWKGEEIARKANRTPWKERFTNWRPSACSGDDQGRKVLNGEG